MPLQLPALERVVGAVTSLPGANRSRSSLFECKTCHSRHHSFCRNSTHATQQQAYINTCCMLAEPLSHGS